MQIAQKCKFFCNRTWSLIFFSMLTKSEKLKVWWRKLKSNEVQSKLSLIEPNAKVESKLVAKKFSPSLLQKNFKVAQWLSGLRCCSFGVLIKYCTWSHTNFTEIHCHQMLGWTGRFLKKFGSSPDSKNSRDQNNWHFKYHKSMFCHIGTKP